MSDYRKEDDRINISTRSEDLWLKALGNDGGAPPQF
jgi:hypothetical protein